MRADTADRLSFFVRYACKIEPGVLRHPAQAKHEVGGVPVSERNNKPVSQGRDVGRDFAHPDAVIVHLTRCIEIRSHPVSRFAEHGLVQKMAPYDQGYGPNKKGDSEKACYDF